MSQLGARWIARSLSSGAHSRGPVALPTLPRKKSVDAKTPKDLHYYEPANGHGLRHDPFYAIIAPRPIGWPAMAG